MLFYNTYNKAYKYFWTLGLLVVSTLLFMRCEESKETSNAVLHTIQSVSFENPSEIDTLWTSNGQVEIENGVLSLTGDGVNTTEWKAKIELDSSWRRIRISGKVRIPSLSPKAQFGKTARLYTAFYTANGDLLSFIGDINFTHLTWRNPFDEWQYFEHDFNLPKHLDNNKYKSNGGKNVMDLRFQVREAKGEMLLDDIALEIIPEKYEMKAEEFGKEILPTIKAEEKIGVTFSQTEIEQITNIIHVNNKAENSSDDNDGGKATPLLTLKQALGKAISSAKPTKIIIHEGDYMEENQIVMKGKRENQPLLVIEGKGKVKITGSKKVTDWVQEGEQVYVHNWKYDMGETEQIWGGKGAWGDLGYIQPEGLRKELVLVNGVCFQQVFHKDSLTNNSFCVDETEDKLWVKTNLNLTDNQNKIEVGILGDLMNVNNRSNLVLRNLSFENGAKFIPFGSVEFSFCENILVENCSFLNNNSTGLLFNYTEHVTVRNCVSNNNGWNGMKFEYAQYIHSKNNEFSYNGWRANMGDLNGWDLAANKNFNTHHFLIEGLKMYDNRGHGLWFDWCNSDITIKNVDIVGNFGMGIFYEVSQGPAFISNARVSQNGRAGLHVAEAWNLKVENSQFYDNHVQVDIRARLRTADDQYSAPAYTFDGRELDLTNNVFSSIVPDSYLVETYSMWDKSIEIYDAMMETYHGKGNRFFHNLHDTAFTVERHQLADLRKHDRVARGGYFTLDEWGKLYDEQNATWEETNPPRLLINGLPEDNILHKGEKLDIEILQENIEVENCKLGLLNTKKYKNKFKYALSEFEEIETIDGQATISNLPVGSYALVAYGENEGKLFQSYRTDLWVLKVPNFQKITN